ncbi:UNVERIFIED_CONTAM: hypothetical protein FKN15_009685 [Acipenser sinensis]
MGLSTSGHVLKERQYKAEPREREGRQPINIRLSVMAVTRRVEEEEEQLPAQVPKKGWGSRSQRQAGKLSPAPKKGESSPAPKKKEPSPAARAEGPALLLLECPTLLPAWSLLECPVPLPALLLLAFPLLE